MGGGIELIGALFNLSDFPGEALGDREDKLFHPMELNELQVF